MKTEILNYLEKGGVSFVEMCRDIPGFEGECQIRYPKSNWVFWSGISEQAAEALHNLCKEGQIDWTPCSPAIYLMDGGWLQLPLVKGAKAYKKPHWLPVTYSLVKK